MDEAFFRLPGVWNFTCGVFPCEDGAHDLTNPLHQYRLFCKGVEVINWMRLPRVCRVAVSAGAAGIALIATSTAAANAATTGPTCSSICILDTRTGAHTDYDRLVFDLSDGTPPYVTADASGDGLYVLPSGDTRDLTIKGSSYLFIQMVPADTLDDAGNSTFTSPTTQTIGLPSLKGVQLATDWEGYVTFGLSLGSYSRYQISYLPSPNREIVDIYH